MLRLIKSAVFLISLSIPAFAQLLPLTCSLGGIAPTIRAEGLSEITGDIVITCSGGTPLPSGSMLPQFDLTIFLNAPVTSRILGSGGASEALLIVDEPGSGLQGPGPASSQLACPTPLTGCSITANGGEPYDGTPGRPNIFQGVVSGNTVTFHGVPFQSAWNSGGVGTAPFFSRIFRITNVRVNAQGVPTSANGPASVNVSVAVSPSTAVPLAQTTLTTAFVLPGLNFQIRDSANANETPNADFSYCIAGVACKIATLRFQENFATATKLKSAALAQNIPGVIYSAESGFFDPAWTTTNPTIAGAGAADSATRLKADVQGVPAGAQLWVAVNGSGAASLVSSETGASNPVLPTDVIGGFPVAALTVTNGAASAIWEVTTPISIALDTYDFPAWVVLPSQSSASGALTIKAALAPNPDDGAFDSSGGASAQPSSYPVPRFGSSVPGDVKASPVHSVTISPNTGLNTGPVTITLTANDSKTLGNAGIVLRGANVPDIGLQSFPLNPVPEQTLQITFDLTGAQAGPRDLVVSTFSGVYTFPNAFTVVSGCAFTASASPATFGVAGGPGQLVVSATPPSCTWSLVPGSDSWITPGAQTGTSILNFSVAPNSGADPRTGTITIAGDPVASAPVAVSIPQLGLSSCTYSISPSSVTFPVQGGSTSVSVTAPSGCSWSASNSLPWVTASGSGSGSGSVLVSTLANSGGLLSGVVTIAGQSLTVTQSASACGANDVTSQVKIVPSAFVSMPPTFSKFAQTVTVTNTSGTAIPGPVSLVFDGLPRTGAPCAANAVCNITPAPPLTHCQSPVGSSIVTFAAGGLAPGQTASATLSFVPGASAGGSAAALQYTPRVFSGTPNQ